MDNKDPLDEAFVPTFMSTMTLGLLWLVVEILLLVFI
jgi:hypothetical protein